MEYEVEYRSSRRRGAGGAARPHIADARPRAPPAATSLASILAAPRTVPSCRSTHARRNRAVSEKRRARVNNYPVDLSEI